MRIILLALAALALSSCWMGPYGNFDHAELNRSRQMWMEHNVQDYYFSMTEGINPPSLVDLYLKDGVLTYVRLENRHKVPVPVTEEEHMPWLTFARPISDFYAEIERLAKLARYFDTVEIEYDDEWHYPKRFSIGWARGGGVLMNVHAFIIDPEYPQGDGQ